MKTPLSNFIQSVLLEVAIDHRVVSGIVDFKDDMHRSVLAEKLIDRGIAIQTVVEVVNQLIQREGKFPERQAFNKDGWLVTFPSQEHKDAAIKRGSHFGSDPTHGKGGMNLYYKRRGKQAREKGQATSETDPMAQTGQPQPTAGQEPAAPSVAGAQAPDAASTLPAAGGASNEPVATKAAEPTGDVAAPAEAPADAPTQPAATTPQAPVSAAVASPVPQPSVTSISVSEKFALQKQWVATPYGNWNDGSGALVAVMSSLDGQIVPINFADRETLKVFAKKEGIEVKD